MAVARSAHTRDEAGVWQRAPVILAGVRAAAVCVMHEARLGTSSPHGRRQSIESQRAIVRVAHRPADNATREDVDEPVSASQQVAAVVEYPLRRPSKSEILVRK
jgi:hypothetical protein